MVRFNIRAAKSIDGIFPKAGLGLGGKMPNSK
jgi:hypothetical protein